MGKGRRRRRRVPQIGKVVSSPGIEWEGERTNQTRPHPPKDLSPLMKSRFSRACLPPSSNPLFPRRRVSNRPESKQGSGGQLSLFAGETFFASPPSRSNSPSLSLSLSNSIFGGLTYRTFGCSEPAGIR